MMGIGYLAVAYLVVLWATNAESLRNTKLAIVCICLCGMAQISQYYDAYRDLKKDLFYYIGIVPPAIALAAILFSVASVTLFHG